MLNLYFKFQVSPINVIPAPGDQVRGRLRDEIRCPWPYGHKLPQGPSRTTGKLASTKTVVPVHAGAQQEKTTLWAEP